MNLDRFPWSIDLADIEFNWPTKRGVIAKKPSQYGHTTIRMAAIAEMTRRYRGDALYIIGKKDKATEKADRDFANMVKESPDVQRRFQEAQDDGERTTLTSIPHSNGRVDFIGARSAPDLSSTPYRFVFGDEYEQAMDAFPSGYGDLYIFMTGRQSFFSGFTWLELWSHPRYKGQGIDLKFTTASTEHEWAWDCPHCGEPVFPRWSCVHHTRTREDGRPDPESAEFRCPSCAAVITDNERYRAVWPPRLGGTGRFATKLSPEEQAARPYVGVWYHGLSSPYKTVKHFARLMAGCSTAKERMTVLNLHMGEDYEQALENVTVVNVKDRVQVAERIVVPGGPLGVQFLAVGVDVQYPPERPTLYASAIAFAPAMAYVVAMERISGFAAMFDWLGMLSIPVAHPPGFAGPANLGVRIATFDSKWETGIVCDNLRGQSRYSAVNNSRIRLLPVQFEAHLHRANPVVEVPLEKQMHPIHRQLGPLERFQLNRHTFVDRTMRRFAEKQVVVLCRPPDDFEAHMTANVLVPKKSRHNFDTDELVWELIDKRHDDWCMSMVYAEAGAAIKEGLDRLHQTELLEAEAARQRDAREPARPSYFSRHRRSGGYWNRGGF
ncbi:MAG: phage terminase large subunit family protein [Phycisphaerales bacterium]|nr:phage terminase large subunit family protein [Phycisphaerales bacterium]